MLETVPSSPPDPILGLSEAFKNDPRAEKINLTIGVFRDEQGQTPVLSSVKKAEQKLLADESTKGYLGMEGLEEFKSLVGELTLGGEGLSDKLTPDRIAAFQAPGGTGALRVASEFAGQNFSGARIWHSTPTWPNHPGIFEVAGLRCQPYPYLASDAKSLDFSAMMDAIERDGKPGDLICLHACCHNPTGVDPTADQWEEIAELTAQRGMLPLVDFAYHGFGDGLVEDQVALRALAAQHEELLICSSYSKNFGLYSERIGALFAICSNAEATENVRSSIKSLIRRNYSNPPRHGGAIVATVLADNELRREWESELTAMRERIHSMRSSFVEAINQTNCGVDFSFLLSQRGMFSFSGLSPMQVDWLKKEKGIYIVGSGRINVAGITPDNLEYLTQSIAEAIKS